MLAIHGSQPPSTAIVGDILTTRLVGHLNRSTLAVDCVQ